MDKIRNEYIIGTAHVGRFGEKTREARLRWCTEERWWEKDAGDGVTRREETGKAKKEVYGCGERWHDWGWSDGGDTEDRNNRRWEIRRGDPWWEKPNEEELQSVWTESRIPEMDDTSYENNKKLGGIDTSVWRRVRDVPESSPLKRNFKTLKGIYNFIKRWQSPAIFML